MTLVTETSKRSGHKTQFLYFGDTAVLIELHLLCKLQILQIFSSFSVSLFPLLHKKDSSPNIFILFRHRFSFLHKKNLPFPNTFLPFLFLCPPQKKYFPSLSFFFSYRAKIITSILTWSTFNEPCLLFWVSDEFERFVHRHHPC